LQRPAPPSCYSINPVLRLVPVDGVSASQNPAKTFAKLDRMWPRRRSSIKRLYVFDPSCCAVRRAEWPKGSRLKATKGFPVKLCECGCGLPAPIAKRTSRSKGGLRVSRSDSSTATVPAARVRPWRFSGSSVISGSFVSVGAVCQHRLLLRPPVGEASCRASQSASESASGRRSIRTAYHSA
jgi:hypothetical protein